MPVTVPAVVTIEVSTGRVRQPAISGQPSGEEPLVHILFLLVAFSREACGDGYGVAWLPRRAELSARGSAHTLVPHAGSLVPGALDP